MPYDIAAAVKLPSQLRAVSLANKNAELQNRILEQNAKYFEEQGMSEASQKTRELDIRAEENTIAMGNLSARMQELGVTLSKEDREQMNNFVEQSAIAQNYLKRTGDVEGANTLWDTLLDKSGARDEFTKAGLEFSPELLESISTASQIKDPMDSVNYWNPQTGDRTTVKQDDLTGIQQAIQGGMMRISPPSMEDSAALGLLGNARNNNPLVNQYIELATTGEGIYGNIDDIRDVIKTAETPEASLGVVGTLMRAADSAVSQAQGLISLVTKAAPNQEEGIVAPNGTFTPSPLNPQQLPENEDSSWQEFLTTMQSGPIKDAVLSSAALRFLIRSLAYSTAKLMDPQGRLDNFDVREKLMLYNVGSLDQLQVALEYTQRDVNRRITTMQKLMDPKGEIAAQLGQKPREIAPDPSIVKPPVDSRGPIQPGWRELPNGVRIFVHPQ